MTHDRRLVERWLTVHEKHVSSLQLAQNNILLIELAIAGSQTLGGGFALHSILFAVEKNVGIRSQHGISSAKKR